MEARALIVMLNWPPLGTPHDFHHVSSMNAPQPQQNPSQLLARLKAVVQLNQSARLKREQQARTLRTITR
jgi:hypothetical protein